MRFPETKKSIYAAAENNCNSLIRYASIEQIFIEHDHVLATVLGTKNTIINTDLPY